jgi:hypothetical protein
MLIQMLSQLGKLPPSVSSTLENLSKRPNVQSTLILSREDGSVISATGFSSEQGTQSERSQEEVSTKYTKEGPTPAEELASAIFQFVSASNSLSSKMEILSAQKSDRLDITSLSNEGRNATPQHHVDKDAHTHGNAEGSEVQLLRMRTKRQEIIIFPDTKFLCCVVQAVGKLGQANGDSAG